MKRAILSLASLAILFAPTTSFGADSFPKGEADAWAGVASSVAGGVAAFGGPVGVFLGVFFGFGEAGFVGTNHVLDLIDRAPTTAETQLGVIEQRPFEGLVQIDHISTVPIDPDNPFGKAFSFNNATVPLK